MGLLENEYILDKYSSIGFKASLIENCVFYQEKIIFMVYVDSGIFLGKDNNKLKVVIQEISTLKTKGIQLTMLASTSRRCAMEPTSSHNAHLLMLSSRMSICPT
jgi:hypothetical protein